MTIKQIYTCQSRKFDINIDEARTEILTELAKDLLSDRYLLDGETFQQAFARAACAFADDEAHAQRIYDYVSNLWFMFSTPVLANGGTKKGLGVSCYLSHVDDSLIGLAENLKENVFLSASGGGIGVSFSDIRSRGTEIARAAGGTTPGIIPFLKVIDSQMLAYHQSGTRRGSGAIYLDISHPEIEEFIEIRKPTGADPDRRCLNLHHGVNVPDAFMEAVENNQDWALTDPHTEKIVKVISARELWVKILKLRVETGEPYIHYVDTSNAALPQQQKDLGLKIRGSNLCTETLLPTDIDRTAVCCLSSVNLAKFKEWEPVLDQFIGDLIAMLDNVTEHFIQNAPPELSRAVFSAKRERALGLGAMGFHSFLQAQLIPFDSQEAAFVNETMFSKIFTAALKKSQELAVTRGEPEDMVGSGRRNSTLIAVAPNASSALIAGVSPGIEPLRANSFSQKTLSGTHVIRNRYLRDVLRGYGKDAPEVWGNIAKNRGSVQGLNFLTPLEKEVFKTAIELPQDALVSLASTRQKFICQGQSLNLFFSPDAALSTVYRAHKLAWSSGVKTLYYLRSEALIRPEEFVEPEVKEGYSIECIGCDS